MAIPLAAAIVPAALSAVSSITSSLVNYGSDLTNNERQRKLMYEANAMQQRNIQSQNRYNSPANQIARLESAGLNPVLMYGNGSAATGQQENVPSVNTPNYVAPKLQNMDMAGAYAPFLQTRLVDSQITKNLADARAILAGVPGVSADSDVKVGTIDSRIRSIDLDNQKTETDIQLGKTNIGVQRMYEKLLDSRVSLTNAEVQKCMYEVTNLQPAAYDKILSEVGVNNAKVSELKAQVRYLTEQINQVVPAMAAYYSESAGKEHSFAALLDQEEYFKEFYNNNVAHFMPESVRASIDETLANIKRLSAEAGLTEQQGKVVFWNTAFNGMNTIFKGVDTGIRAYSAIVTGGLSTTTETVTKNLFSNSGYQIGKSTVTTTKRQ